MHLTTPLGLNAKRELPWLEVQEGQGTAGRKHFALKCATAGACQPLFNRCFDNRPGYLALPRDRRHDPPVHRAGCPVDRAGKCSVGLSGTDGAELVGKPAQVGVSGSDRNSDGALLWSNCAGGGVRGG